MTKEAAFRSLARRTKASNAKYAAMSRAEKRVAIAKDVIRAIHGKQLIPTHGEYFSLGEPVDSHPEDHASLQELLPSLPACNVCAKGAILVCAVARQNKVTFGEAVDWTNFRAEILSRYLGGVFTPNQLNLIEDAFETAYNGDQEDTNVTMLRIMKNIVKNGGTLKTEPVLNEYGNVCGHEF
jgi:hypothetical protein